MALVLFPNNFFMEKIPDVQLEYNEFPLLATWKFITPQEFVIMLAMEPLKGKSFHQCYEDPRVEKIFNKKGLSLIVFHFGMSPLGYERRIMLPYSNDVHKILCTAECFHEWHPHRKLGSCWTEYKCEKCGEFTDVDSSG